MGKIQSILLAKVSSILGEFLLHFVGDLWAILAKILLVLYVKIHTKSSPCRHKVLDLIGDLSIFAKSGNQGLPIAQIVAYKMKRSRHEADGERNVLPAYEKQRMERLRKNAEIMEAKGHGSLANKILKDKAELFSKYPLDEVTFSNEVEECNIRNEKSSMKVPRNSFKPMRPENVSPKSGTMAKYLTNRAPVHVEKQQDECVKDPMHKGHMQLDEVTSKNMAAFLRKHRSLLQQGVTFQSDENQKQQGLVPNSSSMAQFVNKQASIQVIEQFAPSQPCAKQQQQQQQQ